MRIAGLGSLPSGPRTLPPLIEAMDALQPKRLWMPGSVLAYSNYGTALAAVALEDVTGVKWEAYLDDHVLGPLGMSVHQRLATASGRVQGACLGGLLSYGRDGRAARVRVLCAAPCGQRQQHGGGHGAADGRAAGPTRYLGGFPAHQKSGSWKAPTCRTPGSMA